MSMNAKGETRPEGIIRSTVDAGRLAQADRELDRLRAINAELVKHADFLVQQYAFKGEPASLKPYHGGASDADIKQGWLDLRAAVAKAGQHG